MTHDSHKKLEGQISYILMKAGVPISEIDSCLEWAFGPEPLYVPPYPDWIERWQRLHPEYVVNKNDSFVEWIFVIGYLYEKWKQVRIQTNSHFRNLN